MNTIRHTRMHFPPNYTLDEIEIKKDEYNQNNTGQPIKPPRFEVTKFFENDIKRLKFTSNRDSYPDDSYKEQVEIINSEPRVRKAVPLGGSVVDHPDNNPRAWFCHIYGRLRFSGINEDVVRKVEHGLESYIKKNPKLARLVVTLNHVEVYEESLFEEIKDKPANGPDIAMLKRCSIKDMELKDDEICLVCLQKLSDDDEEEEDVKITCMPCNHVFHDNCITKWLMNRRFCPLCRFELGQESDEAKE